MRFYLLAMSFALAALTVNGQQLKVNDEVPDKELPNVLNWKEGNVKLSDFKKKLIILDFWSFICTSCLEAFPHIDSLQKEFNNEVQFVAVNNESLTATKTFIKNHPRIHFPAIPFVTGDSILSVYFPRVYVPWHIWIDSNKTVKFITDGWNATRNHIKTFLSGENISLNQLNYSAAYLKPNSLLGNPELLQFLRSYSYISTCVPEVFGDNYFGETEGNFFRLSQNCVSMRELLQEAYGERGKYDFRFPSTCHFSPSIPDSVHDYPGDADKRSSWIKEHRFTYVSMLPVANASQAYSKMQRDLCNFFQVNVTIEKRLIDCFSLVRISNLKTVGFDSAKFVHLDIENFDFERNERLSEIVSNFNFALSGQRFHTFIVDRTGYKERISLALKKNLFEQAVDIKQFNLQLEKYNLKLIPDKTITDVMVIEPDKEK